MYSSYQSVTTTAKYLSFGDIDNFSIVLLEN